MLSSSSSMNTGDGDVAVVVSDEDEDEDEEEDEVVGHDEDAEEDNAELRVAPAAVGGVGSDFACTRVFSFTELVSPSCFLSWLLEAAFASDSAFELSVMVVVVVCWSGAMESMSLSKFSSRYTTSSPSLALAHDSLTSYTEHMTRRHAHHTPMSGD
jgi:hypothetical protein